MIKTLLKLAFFLAIGLLTYNYFLGTEQEKENATKIVNEVKDVGKSFVDLLKSERDKMRDGKYDDAFDKISDAFQSLKDKVKSGSAYVEKLGELEEQKDSLVERLKEANNKGASGEAEKKALGKDLERLMNDVDDVKTAIEAENKQ